MNFEKELERLSVEDLSLRMIVDMDEEARERYHQITQMPIMTQEVYKLALLAYDSHRYEEVIELLEPYVDEWTKQILVYALLGEAYLKNGNSGKAIMIFEELLKYEPDRLDYQLKLAISYKGRDYVKKAENLLESIVRSHPECVQGWKLLGDVYFRRKKYDKSQSAYEQGFRFVEPDENLALELHVGLIGLYLWMGRYEQYTLEIEKLERKIEQNPYLFQQVENGLVQLVVDWMSSKPEPERENIDAMIKISSFVLRYEPKQIDMQFINDSCEVMVNMLQFAEDEKILPILRELIEVNEMDCGCEDCQIQILDTQWGVLDISFGKRKTSLTHLKEQYPNLYQLNEDFLEKALDLKASIKLKGEIERKLEKFARDGKMKNEFFVDDFSGDEDVFTEQKPYVREEVKVGRNEPCPCSSGKKYKKCCGR